jgi:hypothetical protein
MSKATYAVRRISQSLCFCMALVLVASSSVQALSADQKRLFQSGVYQFDSEVPSDDSSCEGSVRLTGNSNTAKAFNFFTDPERGLSADQSAGIVANLIAESEVFPTRKQDMPVTYKATLADIQEAIRLNRESAGRDGFGIGIAQWTSYTRLEALLAHAGDKSPLTMEAQLPFLWSELPGNGLEELKNANSLEKAVWIFMAYFERPGVVVDANLEKTPNPPTSGAAKTELDRRIPFGQGVLDEGNQGGGGQAESASGCGSFGGALDGNESEPDFNKDYNVTYNGPPPGNFNESDCTGGLTPGAKSLADIVMEAYSPPVTSVGGYSCRQNTNDETISIHGVGRAIDIMIDGTTPEGKEVGDRIRNLMINNAENIGIQVVIWDRHIWSVNHKGWRPYSGLAHTDHLHVEVNVAASENPNLGK